MQKIGTYTVTRDADSLEGWSAEQLAEALRVPLGDLGIEVEYAPHLREGGGLHLVEDPEILSAAREQYLLDAVDHVLDEVITTGSL